MHYWRWQKHGDPLWVRPKVDRGICAIEDCSRPVERRGWRSLHYQKWRQHEDPLGGHTNRPGRPCRLCDKPAAARGWCSMHYTRWLDTGDPGAAEPKMGATAAQRARSWMTTAPAPGR
jgi:hypothetical protein